MHFSSPTQVNDPIVYRLIRQVRRAIQKGDLTEAGEQCKVLLNHQPDYEAALSFLSDQALQQNGVQEAAAWAKRGIGVLPNSAILHFNLGCALEKSNSYSAARDAFIRALQCNPELLLARFYLASQEEQLGNSETALKLYAQALTSAKKSGMLDSGHQYSHDVHKRVNHAIATVQNAREHLLSEAFQPLLQRHGYTALQRVLRAFDVYLGKAQVQWPHPLQRPTFLLIPDLPPQAWFEREQFPFLAEIESLVDVIRQEFLNILAEDDEFRPYVDMPDNAPAASVWRELNRSPRWSAYHLFRHGQRIEEHCKRCPKTVAALERLPIMRVPDHSPEALFSVLKPRTHIPPHTGVVNGRLTVHLPLIVPPNCGALKAGEEARTWQEGQCLIFDDSMFHEAWNDSDSTRVVLIFDIWNPYLTDAEREAMAVGVATIGRFNRQYCDEDDSYDRH